MIERLILLKKGQYGTSFSNQPRTYYLNLPYVHQKALSKYISEVEMG